MRMAGVAPAIDAVIDAAMAAGDGDAVVGAGESEVSGAVARGALMGRTEKPKNPEK